MAKNFTAIRHQLLASTHTEYDLECKYIFQVEFELKKIQSLVKEIYWWCLQSSPKFSNCGVNSAYIIFFKVRYFLFLISSQHVPKHPRSWDIPCDLIARPEVNVEVKVLQHVINSIAWLITTGVPYHDFHVYMCAVRTTLDGSWMYIFRKHTRWYRAHDNIWRSPTMSLFI